MQRWMRGTALAVCLVTFAQADVYYEAAPGQLDFPEEGVPPSYEPAWKQREIAKLMYPRVLLDGAGEALFHSDDPVYRGGSFETVYGAPRIVFRLPEKETTTGFLIVPAADWIGMIRIPFVFDPARDRAVSRKTFLRAQQAHYRRLRNLGIPGTAWFAWREAEIQRELADEETTSAERESPPPAWIREADEQRLYAFFSGGRALAENLQIDRPLDLRSEESGPPVQVDTIPGITIREFDWSHFPRAEPTQIDPLARCVPRDQYALFFPDTAAARRFLDESQGMGIPLLRSIEPRAEDARTLPRYERQLGISFEELADLLDAAGCRRIVLTGSDPYFRMGTDFALLFEGSNPEELFRGLLGAMDRLQRENADAVSSEETISSTRWRHLETEDGRIRVSVARAGEVVVLSNSPFQQERILSVMRGERESLASADEYRFFRARYPAPDEETAFLILTDDAIRRWCGPRARIGNARRIRAAAALSRIQAIHARHILAGETAPEPLVDPVGAIDLGRLTLGPSGVRSSIYGTLAFMTPIAELGIGEVSAAEKKAYEWWRDNYQRNWSRRFDPIAVRFRIDDATLAMDLTVMPLIDNSEYRDLLRIAGKASITAGTTDPHPEALVHFAMAVDPESEPVRDAGNMAFMGMTNLGASAFSWLGGSLEIYLDEDPFWAEARSAADLDAFLDENFRRTPIVLRVASKSSFGLAQFLTGVRMFVEQAAPGMLAWEPCRFEEVPYVRIREAKGMTDSATLPEDFAVYYAPTPSALLVTLNERCLFNALRREKARSAEPGDDPDAARNEAPDWLGSTAGLRLRGETFDVLDVMFREDYRRRMRARAWGNIPILNEWRRRFPGRDPVETHELLWKTRLVDPDGGAYVWNETWGTMESTTYGHPGQPGDPEEIRMPWSSLRSADFGFTLEYDGLRARCALSRKDAPGGVPTTAE